MRATLTMMVLATIATGTMAAAAPTGLVWVEGESAARSQVGRNAWFDLVDSAQLSGRAQIASLVAEKTPPSWAEFDINIPDAGPRHFWIRAALGSGVDWSFDGGAKQVIDGKAMGATDKANARKKGYEPLVQQRWNTAADGEHDARIMTWYNLGTVELAAGQHKLRLGLGGDDTTRQRFAAVDCFVLSKDPFTPNFQYQPGEAPTDLVGFEPGQTWDFKPPTDAFAADALLDLRDLNEKIAGEHGFIRLGGDGNDFARGDGQPIRFWGGSTYTQRDANKKNDQQLLERHARFLAKRGVNIVRLHGAIYPKGENSAVTDVDEKELDEIYRLVAAMKTAGVYTIISPYWGSHAKLQKSWGVADPDNATCAGLVFFDPVMQKGYKAWLKRIYADVNPYTKIPLSQDPAVAIIQIQNEDSMLFYTMQGVKGQALLNLRKMYGDWVLKKYGSFDKMMQAWKGLKLEDDDLAAGRPGMFIVWEFTEAARKAKGGPDAPAGRELRLADQLEFMTQVMSDFNREIGRYLREDLGCKQLVNAGNWRTADQTYLDDAERVSYMANEVIGKNHYFGAIHNGLNTGWQILPGQVFTNRSYTRQPIGGPLNVRQSIGRPFIIPESLWVPPNRWEAEGPLVVAAQSCLTGLDTFYWFATGEVEWVDTIRKWTFATPMTLGQFPAAAMIFRKGLVQQSPAVVHEERSAEDVWFRRTPMIAEQGAWDPNRDTGDRPGEASATAAKVDPLAFLVGRVEVKYNGDPARSTVIDLKPYIDADRQMVRSATGEMTTNLKTGVYTVNSPKAQAAAGFLKSAGAQKLADVTIDCGNEYASIIVVPMDDKTIAQSGKILVQAGTTARPTGWKERAMQVTPEKGPAQPGFRIMEVGKGPWQVEKTKATVTIRNSVVTKATVLDANGMPAGDLPVRKTADGVTIDLPAEALYVVLQ